jgi:hypothetical protein
MHLSIPYLVAALGLASTASADYMKVNSNCNQWGHCTHSGRMSRAIAISK